MSFLGNRVRLPRDSFGALGLGSFGLIASRTSSPEENSSELSVSVSESATYRDSECNKAVGGKVCSSGGCVRTSYKIISKASNHQVGGLTNEMVFKVILNNGKGTSVDKARGKRFGINGLEDGMVPRI